MTGVQTCALPICFPVTIEDNKEARKRQRRRRERGRSEEETGNTRFRRGEIDTETEQYEIQFEERYRDRGVRDRWEERHTGTDEYVILEGREILSSDATIRRIVRGL